MRTTPQQLSTGNEQPRKPTRLPDTSLAAIDGGGTYTRARIARADGSTVSELTVRRTAKFFVVGFEESAKRIAGLILRAAARKNVPANRITAICVGLAGNGRDSDQRRLHRHLMPALRVAGIRPNTLRLESDATIALPGLLGESEGVVLICGTGCIAIGRTSRNRIVRVGGWGHIFGDEGSGYWLGVQALNAVARELDARGPKTLLTDAIFRAFLPSRTREPRELRSAIASGSVKIERVAPLVTTCAERGDKIAGTILRRAAEELCDQLEAMHRVHFAGRRQVPLVFHGGVVESSPVGAMLAARLRKNMGDAYRVTPPYGTPLDGAIALLRGNAPKFEV